MRYSVGLNFSPNTGRHIFFFYLGLFLWASSFSASAKSGLSGALLYSSDYIQGGYSKSDGHGVAQANLDFEMDSGLYSGLWLSPVNLGDRAFSKSAHLESSPYIGIGRSIGYWWLNGTATVYLYDEPIFGETAHYGVLSLETRFQELFAAYIAWKPDYFGRGKPAYDYKVSGRYLITDTVELSYSLGYSDVNSTFEYNYIYHELGATAYYKTTAFSIRFHNINETDENNLLINAPFIPHAIDSKWTATLSYSF